MYSMLYEGDFFIFLNNADLLRYHTKFDRWHDVRVAVTLKPKSIKTKYK